MPVPPASTPQALLDNAALSPSLRAAHVAATVCAVVTRQTLQSHLAKLIRRALKQLTDSGALVEDGPGWRLVQPVPGRW